MVLLVGGARSGKSALAVALARRRGGPVVFLATAEAGDAEMADRIALHARERPAEWRTVEEPLALEAAVAAADRDSSLIVDCLSLWTANALAVQGADEVVAAARSAATAATRRPELTVAVTNEVGMGIVPASPTTRAYRDVLGRVNAAWSLAAHRAYLVVAGRALPLAAADDLDG